MKKIRKMGGIMKARIKAGRGGLLLATVFTAMLLSFYIRPVQSADEQALRPRVPEAMLAQVQALRNTVPSDARAIEEARKIFQGRGSCFTCHGEKGRGDGPTGASFNPPPRNFTDIGWQRARTEGEIFWAITNGTGYGMPVFGDMLSDEERWMLVDYVRELGKGRSDMANKDKE